MYIDVSYSAQPALRHTDQVQQYCDGVKRIIDVVIVLSLSPIWALWWRYYGNLCACKAIRLFCT